MVHTKTRLKWNFFVKVVKILLFFGFFQSFISRLKAMGILERIAEIESEVCAIKNSGCADKTIKD